MRPVTAGRVAAVIASLAAFVAQADGLPAAAATGAASATNGGASATTGATPAGDASALTFGGEARLRYTMLRNARLVPGNDSAQAQFRGLVHVDYRVGSRFRLYGEAGTGQVDRDRDAASASLQNRASLQQLYVDVATGAESGATRFGAMLGRQEFAEGPRQLVSAGDGANLRRTWNGVRAYAQAAGYKVTLFEFRATRLAAGAFDEGVRGDTLLRGAMADIALAHRGGDAVLQPFWLHTTMQATAANGGGIDTRDTLGARLTGSRGPMRWDWTIARQQGRAGARDAHAWGLFAVQSLSLSTRGWKPRLTSHVDFASRDFNPLYASSSYLGEGQFLGLANLLLVAPGIAVSPSPRTTLSLEFGHARRVASDAPAYAGATRAYAGTASAGGRHIGNLTRLAAEWKASRHWSFNASFERLAAGSVLDQAGFASGSYVQVGGTVRY
jgi:hypothetical protein